MGPKEGKKAIRFIYIYIYIKLLLKMLLCVIIMFRESCRLEETLGSKFLNYGIVEYIII